MNGITSRISQILEIKKDFWTKLFNFYDSLEGSKIGTNMEELYVPSRCSEFQKDGNMQIAIESFDDIQSYIVVNASNTKEALDLVHKYYPKSKNENISYALGEDDAYVEPKIIQSSLNQLSMDKLTRLQESKIISTLLEAEYGLGYQVHYVNQKEDTWHSATISDINRPQELPEKLARKWGGEPNEYKMSKTKTIKGEDDNWNSIGDVDIWKVSYNGKDKKAKNEISTLYCFVGCGKTRSQRLASELGLSKSLVGAINKYMGKIGLGAADTGAQFGINKK